VARVSEEIATNKADLIAKGQWPKEFPATATAEDIAKYINDKGVISILSNHVESARAYLKVPINNNPYEFGLPGSPTPDQVEEPTNRIVSGGITGQEINEINNWVLGLK